MIVETAHQRHDPGGLQQAIAHAPPAIRRAINRRRAAAGLNPVLADEPRAEAAAPSRWGAGLWWDRDSPHLPAGLAADRRGPPGLVAVPRPTVSRVLIVPAHGTARARDVGGDVDEWVRPGCFGSADELNRSPGWTFREGHDGPAIAVAGRGLVAHDSPIGPVLEWRPRLGWTIDDEILDKIVAGGCRASVSFVDREKAYNDLPRRTRVIRRATLLHVALVGADERPAYPAAVVRAYLDAPDTPGELARQLRDVVGAARWHDIQR